MKSEIHAERGLKCLRSNLLTHPCPFENFCISFLQIFPFLRLINILMIPVSLLRFPYVDNVSSYSKKMVSLFYSKQLCVVDKNYILHRIIGQIYWIWYWCFYYNVFGKDVHQIWTPMPATRPLKSQKWHIYMCLSFFFKDVYLIHFK